MDVMTITPKTILPRLLIKSSSGSDTFWISSGTGDISWILKLQTSKIFCSVIARKPGKLIWKFNAWVTSCIIESSIQITSMAIFLNIMYNIKQTISPVPMTYVFCMAIPWAASNSSWDDNWFGSSTIRWLSSYSSSLITMPVASL